MNFEMNAGIGAFLGAVICLGLIPLLARHAHRIGLVDVPTGRKQHAGNIPVAGGIAIYGAALMVSILVQFQWDTVFPLLMGALLVVTGLLDDIYDISARKRLPVQILAALGMIVFGGQIIHSIGSVSASGPIVFGGVTAIVVTVICTIGVINSINMIDGVDGLSGSVLLLTLAPLTYYSWLDQDYSSVQLMLVLMGALIAFLYYNGRFFRPRALVFMGDAGTTFFGFFLVWFFIKLSQGSDPVLSPISAGWIFGLPLADTVSVMVGRIIQKRSPFDADRNHLHHCLLDAGFSPNKVVMTMSVIHLLFVLTGMLVNEYRQLEPISFWLFVGLVIAHHFLTPGLVRRVADVQGKSLERSTG